MLARFLPCKFARGNGCTAGWNHGVISRSGTRSRHKGRTEVYHDVWHEVCMRLARGLQEVGTRFARGLHEVGMRLAQGWHEVGTRFE